MKLIKNLVLFFILIFVVLKSSIFAWSSYIIDQNNTNKSITWNNNQNRKAISIVDETENQKKIQSDINITIYLLIGSFITIISIIRYYNSKKSKDRINEMLKFIKKDAKKTK